MLQHCRKCGEDKLPSEFYRSRKCECKECHKAHVRANRRAKREYYRAQALKPDRVNARKAYRDRKKQDPNFLKIQSEYVKNWRSKNAVKTKAHAMVGNAIKRGRIKRRPCEVCGAEKAEAHHENYYKPLEVRWLCRTHHMLRHREINEDMRQNPRRWKLRGFTPDGEPQILEAAE